jgi:cytochrome c biogenesis protein CcmG/thiol:disulfide interchange protein DsbE
MKILRLETINRSIVGVCLYPLFCYCAELIVSPAVGWSQHLPHRSQSAAPAVGAPAIVFDLNLLDGRSIGLATFRGTPLIINFFATWCDPCREEMPIINDLAIKGSKDGYAVLGIAVDDMRSAVTQYSEEAKLAFPIALDSNSTVKRAYRIFGPPATFFIDSQGTIRDVVIGPITLDRARAALEKMGTVRQQRPEGNQRRP